MLFSPLFSSVLAQVAEGTAALSAETITPDEVTIVGLTTAAKIVAVLVLFLFVTLLRQRMMGAVRKRREMRRKVPPKRMPAPPLPREGSGPGSRPPTP